MRRSRIEENNSTKEIPFYYQASQCLGGMLTISLKARDQGNEWEANQRKKIIYIYEENNLKSNCRTMIICGLKSFRDKLIRKSYDRVGNIYKIPKLMKKL